MSSDDSQKIGELVQRIELAEARIRALQYSLIGVVLAGIAVLAAPGVAAIGIIVLLISISLFAFMHFVMRMCDRIERTGGRPHTKRNRSAIQGRVQTATESRERKE